MLNFLNGIDKDLRSALLIQLRNLWTHTSTAIEGNTLTLGETAFVLEEGLTISGKPLKDHEEVVGHARAIDLIYDLLQSKTPFKEKELFALHKAVQTGIIVDVYKPVGGWKKEPNSTVAVIGDNQVVFEYGRPSDIPLLMESWFELYREIDQSLEPNNRQQALLAYVQLHVAFVRIHPFFDGNGRLARLISNVPVLKSGLPPIIIPQKQRKQYIDALSAYHFSAGQIKAGDILLPNQDALESFIVFCEQAWGKSFDLVAEIQRKQRDRK
ncbi:MAG: Fic family protein [Desulfobacterales bacterium]|nr:Fic family protein [Desulfobacterales bacterium]MDX2508471.1 Fic family protein [Desulfobacterales bacterium]